MVTSIGKKRLR